MSKWKCEICGKEFDNFHAQGFDNKIYCPLCYFKKENQELKNQKQEWIELLDMFKKQQKEFIEYLNWMFSFYQRKEQEYGKISDRAMRIVFESALEKYKEIIGGDNK